MKLIDKTTIDFLGKRRVAYAFSALLLIASVAALAFRGLAFGIDFTGGVLVEVHYPQPADLAQIRGDLEAAGYESPAVQNFGTARDVLIRLTPRAQEGRQVDNDQIGDDIIGVLEVKQPGVEKRRSEFVGPQVGQELAEQGALAMLFALLMILGYVAFRFQWKFAVGAVAALVHDVVITVGLFAVLQLQFDLSVLAAILAVIGYSLNDTIVVFDRIRENFLRLRSSSSFDVMNASLNQTLSRTLITGLTTLLVLVALYFLGGEVLAGFSIALIAGILIGTYSSIYIASAAALALEISTTDLMPPQREDKNVDGMP